MSDNYLITGATGFLGQRVCDDLAGQGVSVRAQGRNKDIGQKLKDKGYDFIQMDLREDSLELCKGIDIVIHSAALSSPWGRREDFYEINVAATIKLLKSAIHNKVKKFIYISSTSVYFDFTDRFDIKETDPVAKKAPSLYTKTKLQAENELLKFKDQIDIIIIRPRGIFGPRDTSLIPRVIAAHDKGRLAIIGNRDTILDLTYVGNVSHAAILCAKKDIESGQIFNITNGEPVKLWTLIDKILSRTGRELNQKVIPFSLVYYLSWLSEIICSLPFIKREPTFTRYTTGLLAKSQTLNIDKAKDLLGYKPIRNMQESIDETIDWYLKEGR